MGCRFVAMVATLVVVASCAREPQPATYQLSGQILLVRAETQELLIRHGDIVGFMPGMTMPFKVRDPKLLTDRRAGDLITATLTVEPEAAWISALAATGSAPLPADTPRALPAATGVHPLQVGDTMPSVPLQASDGNVALVADPNRVGAVTFIYTSCPLPDYCPLMDKRFAEVQRLVAADATLAGHVSLVSVSVDPAVDTAARLAEHAASLGADPAVWRFASLDDDGDIERFAAQFGVNVIRELDGSITHNLRTLVFGSSGTVLAAHDGNTWTAEQLVADLRRGIGQ